MKDLGHKFEIQTLFLILFGVIILAIALFFIPLSAKDFNDDNIYQHVSEHRLENSSSSKSDGYLYTLKTKLYHIEILDVGTYKEIDSLKPIRFNEVSNRWEMLRKLNEK